MDHIIEINRRKVFTLEAAQRVIPVIFRITKAYSQKVELLLGRLDTLSGDKVSEATSIEQQINSLIQEWQDKIHKLGALTKGVWIADFDSGDGYFCWKYPEPSILFWHKYTDGFSRRVRVAGRPGESVVHPQLHLVRKMELSVPLTLQALEGTE